MMKVETNVICGEMKERNELKSMLVCMVVPISGTAYKTINNKLMHFTTQYTKQTTINKKKKQKKWLFSIKLIYSLQLVGTAVSNSDHLSSLLVNCMNRIHTKEHQL